MRTSSSCWLSCASLLTAVGAAAGCGIYVESGSGSDPSIIEGRLTASQSFLVSFTGGGIPANASSLVTAAGGTIVARYEAVGAVLVRSTSATFATTARGLAGIEDVGNAATVHSKIGPTQKATTRHAAHKLVPPAGGDPLSPRQWDMDMIHAPQARSITPGKSTVLAGLFDSGVDITHPDLAGRVLASASANCIGGVADPSPAAWTNDFLGHGTFTSGVLGAAKNNVGIVGVAPGVKLAMV